MNTPSSRPIIARVARTWKVNPGISFAVVADIAHGIWIVESCPAGTHFWSVAQFSELSSGDRTLRSMQEALKLGRELEQSALESRPAPRVQPVAAHPRAESVAPPAPRPRRAHGTRSGSSRHDEALCRA